MTVKEGLDYLEGIRDGLINASDLVALAKTNGQSYDQLVDALEWQLRMVERQYRHVSRTGKIDMELLNEGPH